MSERWARTLLSIYRVAGAAAYPVIGGYVAYRATKGKEDRARRRERYGKTRIARPAGPLIWMHAASVGETLAISALIEHLLECGITVVLTTGTVTSAKIADERFHGRIIHQYVPLDLKPAVRRFLDHWKPDLAIFAESEIWPVIMMELSQRRIPQVLVNGRLSDRSFRSWQKRSYLAEALFENFAHVVAQSEIDGERFGELGARPVTISGNLKTDAQMPKMDEAEVAKLKAQIGERPVWAAISTHDGEELIAAQVHRALKKRYPDLLTIIVPRHPDRADAIAERFSKEKLAVARRSLGQKIAAETEIFLGDTIGEMGTYLQLSEIAFVGRSLSAEGGQNPLEPAMLGLAVLSGPNIQNFREAYQRLIDSGAALLVRDGQSLAKAVNHLLKNDEARHQMMAAGIATVDEMRGTLQRTLKALDPFIQPLIVQTRLKGRR
ncbi:MAG: lipid IV(A) 3-deoxy-D-manno-octulosonic acid transferase [Rhizobiaceae bacterium]|nr:lipid IV(A) 3-deoxy-D-manno-octulosonic acid transferase [Rhizobiaceae bacterium]